MRISHEDVERFAAWSGDRNPLHLNPEFARRTHFGQPIVHGMLTVLAALSATAARALGASRELDVEFRSAAVAGDDYDVTPVSSADDVQVRVGNGGSTVLTLRGVTRDHLEAPDTTDLTWVAAFRVRRREIGPTLRDVPIARTPQELDRGVELTGVYALDPVPAAHADGGVSLTRARVLALCSYITGMELPGLRSLFTRVTIRFYHDELGGDELWYRARILRYDRHFRIVDTQLDVATPGGALVATARLRAYVPFSPATADLARVAARLSPATERLRGKVALVCGGTRGLGADLAAALALSGCQVYASARGTDTLVDDRHRDLAGRGAHVDLLVGDSGERAWCESALQVILGRHGRVDLLVLNACAPPAALPIGRDALDAHDEYVLHNLRLVRTPLAAFASALQESAGAVLHVSSSAVDDPPVGWGHYVAVKQAGEGLVRTASRENANIATLIARPPKLRTSWNDTPVGAVGAIPSDWAAVHVVNRLAEVWNPGKVEVVSAFPAFEDAPEIVASVERPGGQPELTVRLAATFTVDALLPGLRFWLRELQINGDIEVAPYGQVLQALLDPSGALSGTTRGINAVLLRVRDWLRELPDEQRDAPDLVSAYLRATARDFERAMRAHRAHVASETLLVLCPSNGTSASPAQALLHDAEAHLAAALSDVPGLQVIVAGEHHARYSVDESQVDDVLRDKIAHIPYRDGYLHTLATIIARHVHRRLTPPRKVLVVDCDNTLWRGVVGEVGAEGVEFDEGHLALQQSLARMTDEGWLVCLCSKNEEPDVWRVFESRPDLRLRREQIVAAMINWRPKSENVRTLASRLNLGLDSFVFVDDNPVECAEMRAGCPEVLTLQWPHEPDRAVRLLQHTWELDATEATAEDQRRTEMYREEFRRQELRAETLTFSDFIDSLGLVVEIDPLAPEDLRRASQLTLRTNQFNFTTRRREEADLRALVSSGRHDARVVRVRDRFGDYGLVGLLIVEQGAEAWTLDTFLLSCRVLGRGVEHRVVAELGRLAAAAGVPSVTVRVERTKRNTPAWTFLESIVPSDRRTEDTRVLECSLTPSDLVAVRFESTKAAGPDVEDTADGTPAFAGHGDTDRIRRREAQIARAAFELAHPAGLLAAIDGQAAPTAITRPLASQDIAAVVYAAFAAALRTPADRVKMIDRLEALGCDSLKIVEITVALTDRFPWLPSTLLFEHRSISQIVEEIARLSDAQRQPAALATPTIHHPALAQTSDIAVVGLHARCAGANSPAELWDLLSGGRVAVTRVPADREYFLHPLVDTRPHWAGLLGDVSRFDAELFGISPREAEFMDPQLRLFLEVAWSALEDAGCLGPDHDVDTGVFAGVMYGDYGYEANVGTRGAAAPYRCWEGFSLANRLSQLLGYRGPSLAVNTACSSSATALHLACNALRAGDCRVAIVGGVNLILDPDRFASLGRLGILASAGRCEPFGADADGTVLGEGAGVVVLRPLEDARKRGDRIYGVIKGTGISTGNGTVGFTAPNPQAQAEAIRRSLRAAGIDPRTVSYVETHGTGTALGDPIEVRGLTLAYTSADLRGEALTVAHRCSIGSLKPNIGHLEAGAGVLGLIKLLLQLERGMLAPSITSAQPNPQIPFSDIPFDVQRELAAWERPVAYVAGKAVPVPRRGGLSSFGVGGANVHVIVEEAPEADVRQAPVDRPAHVVTLSARTDEGLRHHVAGVKRFVEAHPDVSVPDLCYSLNTGRQHFDHRLAMTAMTRDELVRVMSQLEGRGDAPGCARGIVSAAAVPKVAFLFTGQGCQYAGMGKRLYDAHPVFRQALDRCAEVLSSRLDRPLLDLLFAREGSSAADLLNQTGYTQPALVAIEYALARLWESWGVRADAVLGHSVGEITAMIIAGGVSLEDGLELVAARGCLMQALPAGGAMMSFTASEERVVEAIAGLEESVAIAAINAPGQVVISGAGTAVADLAARLRAEGIRGKALTVSHAFHSPLMRPMLADFERVVRRIRFSPPRTPFVSCVDASLVTDEVTRAEYWVRQILNPVRFADSMKVLRGAQVTAFVETGPQPVLLGMGRQCLPDGGDPLQWLPSMRKDADAWQTLLGSLGQLYVQGAAVDWRAFDAPYARRRVSAPGYPFAQKKYWLRNPLRRAADCPPQQRPADVPCGDAERNVGPRVYDLVWRKQPRVGAATPATQAQRWVVLADTGGIGSRLARLLADRGAMCTLVVRASEFRRHGPDLYEINAAEPAQFDRLWTALNASGGPVSHVAHLWSLDVEPGTRRADRPEREARLAIDGAVHLVRAVTRPGAPAATVWFITRGAVPAEAAASEPLSIAQAPIWGLGRTIALEHPEVWGGLVDLSCAATEDELEALAIQLAAPDHEDQVALRDRDRYVARLVSRSAHALSISERAAAEGVTLDPAGTYLVTGGLGALGLHVARWLVERGARRLVLAGRRAVPDSRAAAAIRALESLGAAVTILSADVARPEDVDRLFARINSDASPLRGVVHAAGVDRPVPLRDLTSGDIGTVLAPKLSGTWLLHERTRELHLDLFLCFSSIAAILGSNARAHYAAANAFVDALVLERRRVGLPGLAVNWGPWKGGGMASDAQLREFERIGNRGLDPQDACRVLDQLVGGRDAQVSVADIDWESFRPVYEARRERPILSELTVVESQTRAHEVASPAVAPWVALLQPVTVERRERELAMLLRCEVAETLGFDDPASVPLDRNFYEIGVDSLLMADLVGRLRTRVGMSCSALVFDHPNVQSLAARLLERLPLETGEPVCAGVAVLAAARGGDVASSAAVATIDPVVTYQRAATAPAITGYDPAAEPEIFAFQSQVFTDRPPDMIAPRWRWMFVESARRLGIDPQFWVYRDRGSVVGHMGSIPVRLQIGSEERTTGWLVDTMVAQAYRNQAVGARLMVQAHEDVPFALSLGQTAEMREIQFRLGWKQVAPLHIARLLLRPENVLRAKLVAPAARAAGWGLRASTALRRGWRHSMSSQVAEVARFEERHDRVWEEMSRDVRCAVVRDASYLNWKYVEQPGQRFLCVELLDGDLSRGLAVLMLREPDAVYRYRRAFLVDLVAPLADGDLLQDVVTAACAIASRNGADALICFHTDGRLTRALCACGFHLRRPERYLLVDPGPLAEPALSTMLSPDAWYVTQGDSDIDRPQ